MNAAIPDDAALELRTLASIDELDAAEWNALAGCEQPFLRHEFLAALEHSAAVGPGTGWLPRHLVLRRAGGGLAGALPLYLKDDSWGEFVFDFAWADAYRRAGLNYYPKLVAAVPFTPVTGARLLLAPDGDAPALRQRLLSGARELAVEIGASSLHLLFPPATEARELAGRELLLRKDCQFHWQNRNYADFDAFLAGFSASKRKKVRRERRRVREAGVEFSWLGGAELDAADWRAILPLYADSFWRRGREPYLNEAFFREIAARLPEQLLVIMARHRGQLIGVAICFRDRQALYGRYWGSSGRYHSLHFETCYYQGIEYCIHAGLRRFEPGTQGEHKISRGFAPVPTWSLHWLADPQFAAAVAAYLQREREYVDEYMQTVRQHLPYRHDHG